MGTCSGCGRTVEDFHTAIGGKVITMPRVKCDACIDADAAREAEAIQGNIRSLTAAASASACRSIPPRYREADLGKLRVDESNRRAVDACRTWAMSPRPGFIYFSGPTGSGKTWLATALFKSQVGSPVMDGDLVWASYLELCRALRRDVAGNTETAMERFKRAAILLIDDLDQPPANEPWAETRGVYEILQHRYDYSLITIITSNLDLGAFGRAHGARMADRIAEAGMAFVIGGKSRRAGAR
jgi:DNA replication protein DnaC